MSDLDKILDQLVAGDEDKAKETFHSMVVQQSRDEFNKLQPQASTDAPVQEAVDKSALQAWHSKYNKYEGSNGDKLAQGFLMSYIDTGILSDGAEINEYGKVKEKYGGDALTEKGLEPFLNEMPITKAMHVDYMKIMGVSEADEEDATQAAKMLGYDLIEQDAPVQEAVDKSALKAWYDKYSKYQSNNYDDLVFGMIKAWTDTGILSDAYEENEWAAVTNKFGDDKADTMDHGQVLKMMPISKAMQDDITKIMGEWQGEETMNKVDDMLQDLGLLEY